MVFSCDKSNLFMGYKDSTDVISFLYFCKNVKGHLEFALYHNKVKAVIDRRACSRCRIVTLLCHICEMPVLSPVSFHFFNLFGIANFNKSVALFWMLPSTYNITSKRRGCIKWFPIYIQLIFKWYSIFM